MVNNFSNICSWYFELSKDRKHVAIKSYKYKEYAFNNPELYELIPTKTKNQFRIMYKSNRNTLVNLDGKWGGYVDQTPLNDDPDTAWNIIFYRYSHRVERCGHSATFATRLVFFSGERDHKKYESS